MYSKFGVFSVVLGMFSLPAIAQVGVLIEAVPVPPVAFPEPSFHFGDVLQSHAGKELLVTDYETDTLSIWSVQDPDPVLRETLSVQNPLGVSAADVDGDDMLDIIVLGNDGNKVYVYTRNPAGDLSLANTIDVPFRCDAVVCDPICFLGYSQIFLKAADSKRLALCLDPLLDEDAQEILDGVDYNCPEALVVTCDDRYVTSPAECSTTPASPGIYDCMLAADCRNGDCKWAACALYQAGQTSFLRYAGSIITCAAVFDLEMALCIPAGIL